MDPAELWRRWFETGTRAWADVLQGEGSSDPYGLYRPWFEGAEIARRQMTGSTAANGTEIADPRELWRRWFDASVESWEKSAELGGEMLNMTPRYFEMLEQARTNLMSARSFPKDPLEFAVLWYNATSGPFSEFIQDVIEREEFLEPASEWLQSYASFYKLFARRSEEYLKSLQVPVRSDITWRSRTRWTGWRRPSRSSSTATPSPLPPRRSASWRPASTGSRGSWIGCWRPWRTGMSRTAPPRRPTRPGARRGSSA
jgi:hypothetical protein